MSKEKQELLDMLANASDEVVSIDNVRLEIDANDISVDVFNFFMSLPPVNIIRIKMDMLTLQAIRWEFDEGDASSVVMLRIMCRLLKLDIGLLCSEGFQRNCMYCDADYDSVLFTIAKHYVTDQLNDNNLFWDALWKGVISSANRR